MTHLLAVFFMWVMHIGVHAADLGPKETIERATQGLLNELTAMKVEDRTLPKVRGLVNTYILPVIDQQRIAKSAMGKHWKKASKEQRQEFIDTFRELQIRTYGGAFKAFSGQEFNFTDTRFSKSGNKAVVKGEMVQPGGQRIPINFRLYQGKDKQWRIYDAMVAGIALVKTYRQLLNERSRSSDLDTIIASMRGEMKTVQR